MDVPSNITSFFGYEAILTVLRVVLIILVGFWLSRFVRERTDKVLLKIVGDITLSSFVAQVVSVLVLIVTAVAALSAGGVPTASVVTLLGTAGIAIALALKDSLACVASGIILVILRPYKRGDFVDVCSVCGTVQSINLFNTVLITADGKVATVPNSSISGSTIVNYSSNSSARIECKVGVSYDCDVEFAKQCIVDRVSCVDEFLKDKPLFVGVVDLSSSSVVICVRVWVDRSNGIVAMQSKLVEVVKLALNEAKVEIPYNKLDVRMY